MLQRAIFDRERAYPALKYDPGSCQNAKRARFGLSVNKMRGGVLFLDPVERLYEISRVMCALKPGARRLGRPDAAARALNALWERRRKQRQRPPFSAAFPPIRSCWWIMNSLFERDRAPEV
jgi:hypothetical protein